MSTKDKKRNSFMLIILGFSLIILAVSIFYSMSSKISDKEKEEIQKEQRTNLNGKSVNRQIKDVFSSPNFVYKANVSIKLTDGTTQEKTIIGRTNNSLITIDDELIDVSKISQIDFLD